MARTNKRNRFGVVEVLLGAALVFTVSRILLPALADLRAAGRLEAEQRARAEQNQQQLHELDRTLFWLVNDPEADPRLYEELSGAPYRPAEAAARKSGD